VWSNLVVLNSARFDYDLCLRSLIEPLCDHALVPEFAVSALIEAIQPGLSWFDERERIDAC